jgi:L-threonylcarbamoyladenylate synthase
LQLPERGNLMPRSIIQVKGTMLLKDSRPSIARAASIIRSGGLVAFPTETVYGLGASAVDAAAIKKIFDAKGRPADNPLIVHIAHFSQLEKVACNIPEKAFRLAEKFWPGPLSLILQRSALIPPEVSAGLHTVAVRMPDHRAALDLIALSGVPIAAPSANRSGKPSPTSYSHVLADLIGRIDAVIKSDDCLIGVESTVLDITGQIPIILRPGGVNREALEQELNCKVLVSRVGGKSVIPVSPGMKYRHYSPDAALILLTGSEERRRKISDIMISYYRRKGLSVGVLNTFTRGYPYSRL